MTQRTAIISVAPSCPVVWCAECQTQVQMITPEQAALLALVNTRTIYRWVENGGIHFIEPAHGALLVCPDSLPRNEQTALPLLNGNSEGKARNR